MHAQEIHTLNPPSNRMQDRPCNEGSVPSELSDLNGTIQRLSSAVNGLRQRLNAVLRTGPVAAQVGAKTNGVVRSKLAEELHEAGRMLLAIESDVSDIVNEIDL